ncbi:FecCD family ABC transporter permease [Aeromicrobium sp. P5_D10]
MTAIQTQRGPRLWTLRAGRVSGLVPMRALLVAALGFVLTFVLLAFNVSRGEVSIPLLDVVRALFGQGDSATMVIVREIRLPQAGVAVLVGAALGLAGALTQTFARNPLATPDMIGITDGAAAAAVGFILVTGTGTGALASLFDSVGLSASAFIGGMTVAVLLYILSWRRGINGQRLILIGIGLGFMLQAITHWLLIKAKIEQAQQANVWLNGSLSGRDWNSAEPLIWGLLILVPISLFLIVGLRLLQLGDDSARSLGLRVQWHQVFVLVCAVGLCALVVSVAGPIDFVAFVVPQVAMRLSGCSRPPLVASMAFGAALVVAADVVARSMLPVVLPAGIVTSAIGAPYLIWILLRSNRKVSA